MAQPWDLGPRPGAGYQDVLNAAWPLRDRRTGQWHARGIPDQPNPIPVVVRVVFAKDGETWLSGHAARWTRTHVYVTVVDRRLQVNGVWVLAGDVRRRESAR